MAQFHMTNYVSLEKRIHRDIPISKQLDVRVASFSPEGVTLTAPLAPNTNHESTAFGGSIYCVAVLSCWALVSEILEDIDLNVDYVVIQDGKIDYVRPVDSDFSARSFWSSPDGRLKFLETLRKKGRARVSLGAEISTGAIECARLDARFVAQVKR
jgi:thioesterase domain-containing protein